MDIPTGGSGGPSKLELGVPVNVNPNRPIKARIKFLHGSWIECVIPANGGFQICNEGDVVEFDLIIDDESVAPIALVDDNHEPLTDKDEP